MFVLSSPCPGCTPSANLPQRFYSEDVLLLSLVDEHGNVDGLSGGTDTPACLGIFEKDPRGAGNGEAGGAGQHPPSIRVRADREVSSVDLV